MSADVFIAFYGIEFPVPDGEALTEIEEQNDVRVVRAREHRLDWWLGRLTDGAPVHLLVGKKIAQLGVEGSHGLGLTDADFSGLCEQTRWRLADAGFQELPKLILKYESDY
jgi:hypothetical protein